jgi:GT2 family glycosyltransferase
MNKPTIFVAVLCGPERYQWPAPGLMMRLIEATHTPDVGVKVATVYGVYGYAAARNRAVETFLASDCSVLCMVDNDTVPPHNFIPRALEFPDADVVALPAYTRPDADKLNTLLCCGWHASEPNVFELPFQLPDKWVEVDVGGAACMFIHRHVLTKMEKPWFRIPEHSFRQHFIGGPGEDFEFCDRVRAAGFHVWTHGGMVCSHLHTVDLTAVADAIVRRNEEDNEIMRKLGLKIPTSLSVRF